MHRLLVVVLTYWPQQYKRKDCSAKFSRCSKTLCNNCCGVPRSRGTASTFSGYPMFWYLPLRFTQMVPETSMNIWLYSALWMTFPDTPKCSRTHAFFTFCRVPKRNQHSLIKVMLFWYFWSHFANRGSKVSINDRFYKVFLHGGGAKRKSWYYQWFPTFVKIPLPQLPDQPRPDFWISGRRNFKLNWIKLTHLGVD